MDIVKTAEEMGFELAGPIEASAIECKRELRDYCNPEECPQYASGWSCPPGAGSFEECRERIASCSCGVVVQTVREGVDFNDVETLAVIRTLHNGRLDELADAQRDHLIQPDELQRALRHLDRLLKIIYKGAFDTLQKYINTAEEKDRAQQQPGAG